MKGMCTVDLKGIGELVACYRYSPRANVFCLLPGSRWKSGVALSLDTLDRISRNFACEILSAINYSELDYRKAA